MLSVLLFTVALIGCNKTEFERNHVFRRQARLREGLTDCKALTTLGIFVSLNFVTLILESSSVAIFGNILNSILDVLRGI